MSSQHHNDLEELARRILVADGKDLSTILMRPDENVEALAFSRVFPDEPAVFSFAALDDSVKFGHDMLHYQFTPDGRWARVDMFDQPLDPPHDVIRRLPPRD